VWASSSSVYGNAATLPTLEDTRPRPDLSVYGVSKLSCEHLADAYAESFELDQIAIRYFTVYGPRQRPDMAFTKLVRALADETPFPVFGTGDQSRDVTYAADAVEATIAAMEKAPAGSVYNVGGGSATTPNNVIALRERLAGRALRLRSESPVTGDVRATSADITRACTGLGWGPRTALEDGLAAQLEWALQAPMRPSAA